MCVQTCGVKCGRRVSTADDSFTFLLSLSFFNMLLVVMCCNCVASRRANSVEGKQLSGDGLQLQLHGTISLYLAL